MAPTLPSSLSPHVCIIHSPDLLELLRSASLPPLPQILQSFSPLPQVTTRTTSLTSIPLSSFALRFSDLVEIESATHEDEEQRALRTMDWITSRVSARCARWVEMVEAHNASGKADGPWKDRTPWWEEVKRCVEGDCVPTRTEAWNHPVAVIYAVSTTAANPLQALQDLHNRNNELPPWVDSAFLKYSLIVHPSNSSLADPIAEALFNAVKKQYGLHSYLLPLALPTSPTPDPVPIPFPAPRLPPLSPLDSSPFPPSQVTSNGLTTPRPYPQAKSPMPYSETPAALTADSAKRQSLANSQVNSLCLSEGDIQNIGRFTREFVVMSMIPWMEKCVADWNESFSSSRRLPSRLFSSTRRLFGSGYSGATTNPSMPTHGHNPSISSMSSRGTHGPNASISSLASISSGGGGIGGSMVTQQRRLAEFATILGDFKLAVSVWESLRKESKGGSDILPLLLSPSPAHSLHAITAVNTLHSQLADSPEQAQLRALAYAVRWDIGIDYEDFLNPVLEGDRWLVHVASHAEETPMALLLGHAAFLSEKKSSRRRAALWYLSSADRLEKGGVKPLAMYFFRKSHVLYTSVPDKELSPSFWESEDKSPMQWRGFDAVLPGIEHELGRLMYTTGDTSGAVKYFLSLLRGTPPPLNPLVQTSGLGLSNGGATPLGEKSSTDKVYLEDFRVAFKHFKATEAEKWATMGLRLPITFVQVKQSRIRLPGDAIEGPPEEWDLREEDWLAFWKSRGKEKLEKGGKAAVDETFWLDLVLRNPLDVDVTLSGLTAVVEDAEGQAGPSDLVEVEAVDDITLNAKETRTIPIAVKCRRPSKLKVTHIKYDFLALLPVTEALAIRGRRLNATPHQRQNKTYAPDVYFNVEVEDASRRLQATFVDDRHLILAEGERKQMSFWLHNTGTQTINEVWMVGGREDELWVEVSDSDDPGEPFSSSTEDLQSRNSLESRRPFRIPISDFHSSPGLAPGESVTIPMSIHATKLGEQDLCLLLAFREGSDEPFRSKRLVRHYDVRKILDFSISARPSLSPEYGYLFNVEMENMTSYTGVHINQLTTLSPIWSCHPLTAETIGTLSPRQVARATFGTRPLPDLDSIATSQQFISKQMRTLLEGKPVEKTRPPGISLHCSHLSTSTHTRSLNEAATRHFIHSSCRSSSIHATRSQHPYIPLDTQEYVFPLHNPYSTNLVVFWEIPSQDRWGHVFVPGLTLGASHAPLREIVQTMESAKIKRSMYAETQREREEILSAVKVCDWNAEMDPTVVSLQDGFTVQHDFSQEQCNVNVPFTIRNYSLTHRVRYILKLSNIATELSSSRESLPPRYVGKLTFRGELPPTESHTVQVKLQALTPGSYTLNGWRVETQVGELPDEASDSTSWRIRQRYEQGPPKIVGCVTIVDTSS